MLTCHFPIVCSGTCQSPRFVTLNIHAFIFTEDFHPYKYKKYRHSCLTRFLIMALENTKGRNVILLNVQGLWSCNVAVFYWFIVGIAYKFIISFSEIYKYVISVWLLGTKMLIPLWVILLMHLWSLIFSFLGWLFSSLYLPSYHVFSGKYFLHLLTLLLSHHSLLNSL